MSINNLPRRPVHYQEGNQDLLKSVSMYSSDNSGTDYNQDADLAVLTTRMSATYRTPSDRPNGNKLFRRYLDGRLDLDYACHIVIDALHRAKQKDVPIGTQEAVVLGVLFPNAGCSDFVDPAMAAAMSAVQLDLTPQERDLIRHKVAAHMLEELNWNAGYAGGSTEGRSTTYDR